MANIARSGESLVDCFEAPRGVAFEEARYDSFRCRQAALPELSCWVQTPCLVTTSSVARNPDFALAQARSHKRGWPVLVRRSGGGTVFHGPGVLCVSLLDRRPRGEAQIEQVYSRFCALLRDGLAKLRLETQVGPLPTAPCDGQFNILANGRKLAGTAARIGLDSDGAVTLAHASIAVSPDFAEGLETIALFECDLGRRVAYDPDCMTGLPGIACDEVAAAIHSSFEELVHEPNECPNRTQLLRRAEQRQSREPAPDAFAQDDLAANGT